MKRIVFIHPRLSELVIDLHSSDIMRISKTKILSIPRLAPMIFAALTPSDYEFVYVDEDYEEVDLTIDADLVAISAMTVQINRAYEIADHFRSRGITVVIGGIHASVLPDEVGLHCDATMIGQGENTWPEMLKDFEKGALKKVYNAKDYPTVEKLVSPKVDAINHDHYLMFPIQATCGCPYDCDFCSVKHSAGHVHRMKPVEQVIAEIREYEKHNSKRSFKKFYFFVDENLYVNRKYTKELLTAMAELKITWTGQGSLDTAFDEEMLELMARSGCRSYAIGFETISDEALAEVNKLKVNKSQMYNSAIQNLIRYGIIPIGYLIFGFDTDDTGVFQRTVDFINNSHLSHPVIAMLTPYPGTRLYDRIKAEGRIFDENWDHYNFYASVFHPKQMSSALLEEGFVWASKQVGNFDSMRKQLEYFWSHGPWPHLKPLTIKERLFLLAIGLKVRKYNKKCFDFILWVVFNRKACDFNTIFGGLYMNERIMKSRKGDKFEELLELEKKST